MTQTDLKKIFSPLKKYYSEVERIINDSLTTGIPLVDQSGLHLFKKGGKKVRASLVILSSGLKSTVPYGIESIAAATEIVHAATLVHDDIIDHAYLRRGETTVSEEWGNKVAVLSGDNMYTTGLNLVVQDSDTRLFPVIVSATRDMVLGELYQMQYSNFDSINREHYFRIIELKTARFMASCAKLGALKASCSEQECDNLYNYGLKIGLAFQLADDILEYLNDDVTGKDIGNDFRDGKITLPAIFLMEKSDKKEIEQVRELYSNPTEDNWNKLKEMVIDSGGIEDTINSAGKFIEDALEALDIFHESEFKELMSNLAGFITERNY